MRRGDYIDAMFFAGPNKHTLQQCSTSSAKDRKGEKTAKMIFPSTPLYSLSLSLYLSLSLSKHTPCFFPGNVPICWRGSRKQPAAGSHNATAALQDGVCRGGGVLIARERKLVHCFFSSPFLSLSLCLSLSTLNTIFTCRGSIVLTLACTRQDARYIMVWQKYTACDCL